MAMDFFEHQDRARRRTGLLLFYMLVAVLLTVVAIDGAIFFASAWIDPGLTLDAWLAQPIWIWATLFTVVVIATGSLTRYVSLSDGGHVVAENVGARRVEPDTTDPKERMLLNVVEEMAIASGMPVPSVWIMDDEPGINAFVAGFQPTQAVLVMTRGGLDNFNRSQMQGVVGHEFSHILNGDMRMNVQLYALLAGILLIGKIGEFMLRNAGRVRGGDRDSAKAVPVLLGGGLMLMVVGYAGLFFGRLIKAAISRQREYLADASSVQFTRDPDAIGEALLVIRDAQAGSLIHHAHAEDMSHMCIALPVKLHLAGLLATHPPIDDRINAIDATLLARDRARAHLAKVNGLATTGATADAAAGTSIPLPAGAVGLAGMAAVAGMTNGSAPGATVVATVVAASVGQPTPAHLDYAMRVRDSIPPVILDLLRQPAGARAVIYGLVVAGTDTQFEVPMLSLVATADGADAAQPLRDILPALRGLGTRLRLPCHDLAMPALRQLPADRRQAFLATLERLIGIDGKVTLHEYLVLSLMRKHLADDAAARRPVRFRNYESVLDPVNVVLSLLCHASGGSDEQCIRLHARAMQGFGSPVPKLLPMSQLGVNRLHAALTDLADLAPLLKKPLLDTCIDCVHQDGVVQVAEIELVRAIGEALDCPVPPLVG